MKKRITIGLVSAALALGGCGAGDAGTQFLSIATAGTGGIYYPLGGALASRLSVADSARRYTAEVTAGAVENVNRIGSDEVDLALTTGNTVYEAYRDTAARPEYGALRIVAPLYPNVIHVLVSEGSGITSMQELRGARLSVGAPGSGTEQTARDLLAAYDFDYDDVEERFLSFTESAAALRDEAIDAAVLSVGYPASAVLEATSQADARLISLGPEAIDRLVETHPYYDSDVIPAGSYPGLEEEIQTVHVMNWIIGRESVEADVVTRLLDILRDDRAALVQVHDIARQIDLDALRDRAPIPVHPAAEQWLADTPDDIEAGS